jgi:hypothetical protein
MFCYGFAPEVPGLLNILHQPFPALDLHPSIFVSPPFSWFAAWIQRTLLHLHRISHRPRPFVAFKYSPAHFLQITQQMGKSSHT